MFFIDSSLGFDISSAWTSNTEFASFMDPLFPHNHFGPKFKHAKGEDTVMRYIESLFTYPHYWKSSLVTILLVGNIDRPVQLAQGRAFHQAEFRNTYLGGSTNGEHSLILSTPP